MFKTETQAEARQHAQGRRDGFHNLPHASLEPAYKARFRDGILERMTHKREGVRS